MLDSSLGFEEEGYDCKVLAMDGVAIADFMPPTWVDRHSKGTKVQY